MTPPPSLRAQVGRSDATWLKDIVCGLTDILSSKVDPRTRGLALKLSGYLSHLFGIKWAVQSRTKFLLFWLNLVSVVSSCCCQVLLYSTTLLCGHIQEVRIATEGKELADIAEKSLLFLHLGKSNSVIQKTPSLKVCVHV